MAPSCGEELQAMLRYAIYNIDGPVAIRYPKGIVTKQEILDKLRILDFRRETDVNRSNISQPDINERSANEPAINRMSANQPNVNEATKNLTNVNGTGMNQAEVEIAMGRGESLCRGDDITIVAAGTMLREAADAAGKLAARGYGVDLISARFIKPFDHELIVGSIKKTGRLLVAEDGCAAGGFGGSIAERLSGIECKARLYGLPDAPVAQAGREAILKRNGLDAEGLLEKAMELLSN
jgi:deoxyxylulose-5-phosphate synthase